MKVGKLESSGRKIPDSSFRWNDGKTITSQNAEETRKWGESLAKSLAPGDIVALSGELGAGKTVLAQGILRGLGVEEIVQSPSFIMAREYNCRIPAVHLDLYRLRGSEEFRAIGLDEYLDDRHIVIIEWAEKIEDLLSRRCQDHRDPDLRRCHRISIAWGKNHPNQRVITYREMLVS